MSELNILCIDDQRDVLASLQKDLEPFAALVSVEACESADEAREVIRDIQRAGDAIALLICDHVMPGQNGIDFLIELKQTCEFNKTRTILLTGLATHGDTIEAINKAHIDNYIEKPWDPEHLASTVRALLTQYVLDAGLDYQAYLPVLDKKALFDQLHERGMFSE